jgi:uroporphyrinogen decarboxylase
VSPVTDAERLWLSVMTPVLGVYPVTMVFEGIDPELVESVMDGMGAFYLDQTLRIMEAARGRVDMVYIADDLSSQQSTLISEAMYRQFLLPRWKSFTNAIKARFGEHIVFHFHSCGAVAPLIPALIESGVDILNPLQPHARGMAPEGLKARFGKQLCFSGGFDIQELLPRGNPREIKRAAQELVHILGKDGGYVASAAHAVQPDTPVDNALAMLEGFKTA